MKGSSRSNVIGKLTIPKSPLKTAMFVRIFKSQEVSLSTFFLTCHFSHSYNYTILFHANFIIILKKSCPGEMKLGHLSPCNVKMSYGKKINTSINQQPALPGQNPNILLWISFTEIPLGNLGKKAIATLMSTKVFLSVNHVCLQTFFLTYSK